MKCSVISFYRINNLSPLFNSVCCNKTIRQKELKRSAMKVVLTSDQIQSRGLELAGFDRRRQKNTGLTNNLARFKAFYGSHPIVYAQIWEDLQTTKIPEAFVDEKTADLDSFLMCFHFLKCYPTEKQLAGQFGICEKTIWLFAKKIQALKEQKIVWPKKWASSTINNEEDRTPVFLFTVDGTHCRCRDPGDPKYFSHKFHEAALNYELALSIYEDALIWIYGPTKAGAAPDITVFREGGLLQKIPAGKKGIADNGYRGEKDKLSTPNPMDEKSVKEFKQRARARHESFNGRLKNFKCLDTRFRHSIHKHKIAFKAVAVICQYQMENGSPLFAPF